MQGSDGWSTCSIASLAADAGRHPRGATDAGAGAVQHARARGPPPVRHGVGGAHAVLPADDRDRRAGGQARPCSASRPHRGSVRVETAAFASRLLCRAAGQPPWTPGEEQEWPGRRRPTPALPGMAPSGRSPPPSRSWRTTCRSASSPTSTRATSRSWRGPSPRTSLAGSVLTSPRKTTRPRTKRTTSPATRRMTSPRPKRTTCSTRRSTTTPRPKLRSSSKTNPRPRPKPTTRSRTRWRTRTSSKTNPRPRQTTRTKRADDEDVSAFEDEMHELQADLGEDWIVRFSVQGGDGLAYRGEGGRKPARGGADRRRATRGRRAARPGRRRVRLTVSRPRSPASPRAAQVHVPARRDRRRRGSRRARPPPARRGGGAGAPISALDLGAAGRGDERPVRARSRTPRAAAPTRSAKETISMRSGSTSAGMAGAARPAEREQLRTQRRRCSWRRARDLSSGSRPCISHAALRGDAGRAAAGVTALGLDAADREHRLAADADHVAAERERVERGVGEPEPAGADEHDVLGDPGAREPRVHAATSPA